MPHDTRETATATVLLGCVATKFVDDSGAPSPRKSPDFPHKWELTLVSRTNNRESDVQGAFNAFRIGIAFTPPQGWTMRLTDTSTLKGMGYSLMGPCDVSVGEEGSELVVNLYKIDDSPDLDLPYPAVNLELIRNISFHLPGDPRETGAVVRRAVAKKKPTNRQVKLLMEEEDEDERPKSLRPAKRRITTY